MSGSTFKPLGFLMSKSARKKNKKESFQKREVNLDEEPLPNYYVVTDVLDLHGLFPEQIPDIIRDFIDNARELKLKWVRIIHGKGKSKLKYIVRKELEDSPYVAWFGDAAPELGGWGATMVELKF